MMKLFCPYCRSCVVILNLISNLTSCGGANTLDTCRLEGWRPRPNTGSLQWIGKITNKRRSRSTHDESNNCVIEVSSPFKFSKSNLPSVPSQNAFIYTIHFWVRYLHVDTDGTHLCLPIGKPCHVLSPSFGKSTPPVLCGAVWSGYRYLILYSQQAVGSF